MRTFTFGLIEAKFAFHMTSAGEMADGRYVRAKKAASGNLQATATIATVNIMQTVYGVKHLRFLLFLMIHVKYSVWTYCCAWVEYHAVPLAISSSVWSPLLHMQLSCSLTYQSPTVFCAYL